MLKHTKQSPKTQRAPLCLHGAQMQGELPPWFNDQCLSILPGIGQATLRVFRSSPGVGNPLAEDFWGQQERRAGGEGWAGGDANTFCTRR